MYFSRNVMFEYNQKKRFITIGVILVAFGLVLFLFHLYNSFSVVFNKFFTHINQNVFVNPSLLGVLYASLFGGLFFFFVPVEAMFIKYMNIGNPWLVFLIYIGGFIVSYTIDYFIGKKFSGITKKIITPKKFYKLKGMINRFGGFGVFFINALPLPSQPLAALLGVFNYNVTRFYVYFLSGQIVKYVFIIFMYGVIA